MLTIALTPKALRTAIVVTIAFIFVSIIIVYFMKPQGNSGPVWSLGVLLMIITLIYYIYMYALLHSILTHLFDNKSFKVFFLINLGMIIPCLFDTIADRQAALAITSLLLLLTGIIIFVKFISIYKSDEIFLVYGILGITSMASSMVLSYQGMVLMGSILPYFVNIGTILILLKTMKILRYGKKWHVDLME